MRLIDAEQYPCSKCETKYCFQSCNRFSKWLYTAVDAVPVIRCKDCNASQPCIDDNYVWCSLWHEEMKRDGFCYEGTRGETE